MKNIIFAQKSVEIQCDIMYIRIPTKTKYAVVYDKRMITYGSPGYYMQQCILRTTETKEEAIKIARRLNKHLDNHLSTYYYVDKVEVPIVGGEIE